MRYVKPSDIMSIPLPIQNKVRILTDLSLTGIRTPLFGSFGPWIVRILCAYELVALSRGVPLPTLTSVVRRRPQIGVVLLGLLTQHLYLERDLVAFEVAGMDVIGVDLSHE